MMDGIRRMHERILSFALDNGGERVKGHCMTCGHAKKDVRGGLCCFVRPDMAHSTPKGGYCHEWKERQSGRATGAEARARCPR